VSNGGGVWGVGEGGGWFVGGGGGNHPPVKRVWGPLIRPEKKHNRQAGGAISKELKRNWTPGSRGIKRRGRRTANKLKPTRQVQVVVRGCKSPRSQIIIAGNCCQAKKAG